MRSRFIMFALVALSGCNGDNPDMIRISGIERRTDIPIPPLSTLRNLEPVALALQVPRQQVGAIVERAPRIAFIIYPCRRGPGRAYDAELYGDGLPLGRDWRLDELDPRITSPQVVNVIAWVPRRVLDGEGYDCGRFEERHPSIIWFNTTAIISNTIRIPAPAAAVAPIHRDE